MPVISSKALASVFDSYSCVVIVSETTEISFTPLACSFFAASMNQAISAVCCSLDSVEGWNSASIHFLAAAASAQADGASSAAAAANAMPCNRNFIVVSCECFPLCIGTAGWEGKAGCPVFQPLRMINANSAIDNPKLHQIDGSCSRPNQVTIFSLTATNARFT